MSNWNYFVVEGKHNFNMNEESTLIPNRYLCSVPALSYFRKTLESTDIFPMTHKQ